MLQEEKTNLWRLVLELEKNIVNKTPLPLVCVIRNKITSKQALHKNHHAKQRPISIIHPSLAKRPGSATEREKKKDPRAPFTTSAAAPRAHEPVSNQDVKIIQTPIGPSIREWAYTRRHVRRRRRIWVGLLIRAGLGGFLERRRRSG